MFLFYLSVIVEKPAQVRVIRESVVIVIPLIEWTWNWAFFRFIIDGIFFPIQSVITRLNFLPAVCSDASLGCLSKNVANGTFNEHTSGVVNNTKVTELKLMMPLSVILVSFLRF